jgi:hypothetical protein
MEVLDVLSFAGKADVYQWEEEDDNLTSKLYWRQTFCRETQELSVSTSALNHVQMNIESSRRYESTAYARGTLIQRWR